MQGVPYVVDGDHMTRGWNSIKAPLENRGPLRGVTHIDPVRLERAMHLGVVKVSVGIYRVESSDGEEWVNLTGDSDVDLCHCWDQITRAATEATVCKHVAAALLLERNPHVMAILPPLDIPAE